MDCGPETSTNDNALWLVDADLSYLDIGIGPMDLDDLDMCACDLDL